MPVVQRRSTHTCGGENETPVFYLSAGREGQQKVACHSTCDLQILLISQRQHLQHWPPHLHIHMDVWSSLVERQRLWRYLVARERQRVVGVRECKNNETVMYVGLLGMTRLTRKLPIALTQANFKGFPGTDSLMSPPKDTKVNLLLNFWGRAECTWKRNKSLLQVGLEPRPFDPQSSALTNRPDATHQQPSYTLYLSSPSSPSCQ